MKKRLSLIIAALMLVNIVFSMHVVAYYDTDNTVYHNAVALLDSLNIMSGKDDNSFRPDENVTRAEACHIIAKMLNVIGGTGGDSKFSDVAKNYWAYDSITYLTNTGVISGGDGKFNPEREITYAEAITMLVRVLGYGHYADEMGGYPIGYLSIAQKAGLTKQISGINNTSEITRGNFALISYNTLRAFVCEVKSSKIEAITYQTGKSFLETYWDIYETDGIITGVWGIQDGERRLAENQVQIDSETYAVAESSLEAMLGYSVKAYYHYDERSDKKTIMHIIYDKKNTSYVIEADDLTNVSDYMVTYLDGHVNKTLNLSRIINLVKNGVYQSMWDSFDIFDIYSGNITFIDNNNDGSMDYAVIRQIDVFVVNHIDEENGLLYEYYDKQNIINIKEASPFVRIRNMYGVATALSEIEKLNVLSIIKTDGEYYDITVSGDTVSGIVTEIGSDDIISVDGEDYRTARIFWERAERIRVKPGESYVFLLDSQGKIAGYHISEITWIAATLLAVKEFKNGLVPKTQFKLFDLTNGKIDILSASDTVLIDGYKCKTYTEIYQRLMNDTNNKKPRGINQVLLYERNADGLITAIDTAEKTEHENEESLQLSYTKENRVYRSAYYSFAQTFLIDTNTLVANMYLTETDDDKIYNKIMPTSLISNYYVCEGYRYGKFKGVENIIIRFIDGNSDDIDLDKRISVVSTVKQGLNADGEVGHLLTIAQREGILTKFARQEVFNNCGGVRKGDTIRYTEVFGEVASIEVIYRYDDENPIIWTQTSNVSSDGNNTFMYRYVYEVYDSAIALTTELGNNNTLFYIYPLRSNAVIYDAEMKSASVALMSDIKGYVYDGMQCSRVIVQYKSGEPLAMVIYR